MKKSLAILVLCVCLVLCACVKVETPEGPVQGKLSTDGISFGKTLEKHPVRVFCADGEVWFDTGLYSNMTGRCGTLDINLEKTVGDGEVPKNDGESNFVEDGAQNVTSITREVPTKLGWAVFKKFEGIGDPKAFDYCYYIRGRLNNAKAESELVVFTNNKDITFSDVYEPLLSSKYSPERTKDNACAFESFGIPDKWGLRMSATDVTPTGLKLEFLQLGGDFEGDLSCGAEFMLAKYEDGKWLPVPEIEHEYPVVWNSMAYMIRKNERTELGAKWDYLYGELEPGSYKIIKKVQKIIQSGDFKDEIDETGFKAEQETYEAQFVIE